MHDEIPSIPMESSSPTESSGASGCGASGCGASLAHEERTIAYYLL